MFPIFWIIDIDSACVSSSHTALVHTILAKIIGTTGVQLIRISNFFL